MRRDRWRNRTHVTCRYEFAQNEFVTCLDSVTLESVSTETGTKDFIAVGTTINRGEDLAVKGAVSRTGQLLLVISLIVQWRRCTFLRSSRSYRT